MTSIKDVSLYSSNYAPKQDFQDPLQHLRAAFVVPARSDLTFDTAGPPASPALEYMCSNAVNLPSSLNDPWRKGPHKKEPNIRQHAAAPSRQAHKARTSEFHGACVVLGNSFALASCALLTLRITNRAA